MTFRIDEREVTILLEAAVVLSSIVASLQDMQQRISAEDRASFAANLARTVAAKETVAVIAAIGLQKALRHIIDGLEQDNTPPKEGMH
jgi:hypothetical protein